MQRIANLVVLEKCCKMRIWVQKSASMQKRTSPLKFGDFAEKSVLNSVSNLSTKVGAPPGGLRGGCAAGCATACAAGCPLG